MQQFPRINTPCPSCQGDGVIDVSYHGSPTYETCPTCNADKTKKFARDMTTNEKLEHLLFRLSELEGKVEIISRVQDYYG